MTKLRIQDATEVERISAAIHDQHFQSQWLTYNAGENSVLVPFAYREVGRKQLIGHGFLYRNVRFPLYRGELRIGGVSACRVHDPAQITAYTLDSISTDMEVSQLTVRAVEDLRIECHVERIDLELLLTDDQIGTKTIKLILGWMEYQGKQSIEVDMEADGCGAMPQ